MEIEITNKDKTIRKTGLRIKNDVWFNGRTFKGISPYKGAIKKSTLRRFRLLFYLAKKTIWGISIFYTNYFEGNFN